MLLFGLTIFASAFLLFQVQPIISKAILPWFGGAAGVWNTCMLFFQAALLAGYAYAHWLQGQPAKRQRQLHLTLLGISLLALPILPAATWKPVGSEDPLWRILALLAATIGLPYFLLSATSPLLQAWYVRHTRTGMPWRLFALSNAASLGALLSYPVLVEPALGIPQQAWLWSAGYVLFLLLSARVAWTFAATGPPGLPRVDPPPWSLRALWVLLAACASTLLLAITTHLTQDVAAIPFLWIIPLAVYLLTFILCFEFPRTYRRALFLPALAVALFYFAGVLASHGETIPVIANIALTSAVLFICCMVCHGELAALKPAPAFLAGFYVALALGGALGGLFVGIAAPLLFNAYVELPIGLWLCAALATLAVARSGFAAAPQRTVVGTMLFATGTLGIWLLQTERQEFGQVELAARNFYGHLQVTVSGAARRLVHGQITHGHQLLDPARRLTPTSYFCRESGAGRAALARTAGVPAKVGILGLGCGALLGYARKGDQYRVYEINPLVMQIARKNFTFLAESPADTTEIPGDGRLSLEHEPPQKFDLLFMDAFSGDAIPVHLVTREAFDLYQRHLKPDAVLVVNITNRYLDLRPVVAAAAARLGKVAIAIADDPPETDDECYPSHYALVMSPARYAATPDFHRHAARLRPTPGFREWTDSFSNLFAIVRR